MNSPPKYWRTLVRAIRHDNAFIYVVLPGYDVHQDIPIAKDLIPTYALEVIEKRIDEDGVYRFHVQADIDVDDPSEIRFQAPWEIDDITEDEE